MRKRNCYIYTRVSTSMQVNGFSLDAQKEKLRKYAEFQEFIVAGEYSDEGKSGKNIEGRPEFQSMLSDIASGKDDIKYVLVFKLSRFGRNAADVLNSLQLMQDYGVNLICVEDGIDSSKDGHKCIYKKQIHQDKVNDAVIEVFRHIVQNSQFDFAIKEKLEASVNLETYEKEESSLKMQIKQLTMAKERLGVQMDRLDYSDKYYEQKYSDMQTRMDSLYDEIAEVKVALESMQMQISGIREQKISQQRVLEFLELFDIMYEEFMEAEKKEFFNSFIKRIDIYPQPLENGQILKSISISFSCVLSGERSGYVFSEWRKQR